MVDQPGDKKAKAAGGPMARLAGRAGIVLLWERIWPEIVAILGIVGLFLAVSWLGLWFELPRLGRILGIALFALLLCIPLIRLTLIRRPTAGERLARLDRDSGLPHHPASGLADRLANATDDPTTRALWQLHRRQLAEAARRLKLAAPSPRMPARDRYALRAAILVAVVAAAFIAGPEKYARIAASLDWRADAGTAKGFRLDAWIDPPPYTAKPPILLPARSDQSADPATRTHHVQAPVGSTVVVRIAGDREIVVEPAGGLVSSKPKATDKAPADVHPAASLDQGASASVSDDREMRWTLKGDSKLVLKRGDDVIAAFDIGSIPDQPPTIALTQPPTSNVRGSLTLSYKINDDYGVNSAEATFAKPVVQGKPITGRTLVGPPRVALVLPSAPGGLGQAQTTADLSDHPWAGARMTMTLAARDDGGNEGKSEPSEITLPQRPFVKPLAKALVELRRDLVLGPDDHARVEAALEGLLIAPERFTPETAIYLGLYTASLRLKSAKTDDDLRGVADFLWQMALQIEDGDLSDAERQLRAAEERLREAMQRGASDEEIKKLTQDLRAALDKFLEEMARRQDNRQNGKQTAERPQRPGRWVTPQDLKSMLDRLDELARSGDMADAQQMLDQLQSILENLKSARRGDQSDQMTQEMDQSLDELDQMTRDQQGLRDDTFRNGQQSKHRRNARRQPGDPNMQGNEDQGDQADNGDQGQDQADQGDRDQSQALQGRQGDLRRRLNELERRMKQFGMKNEQGLDDAEKAMREAEGAIGQGQDDKAVDAQGRALEGLRRGAQGLAQQMQQDGQGQAEGDNSDQPGGRRGDRPGRDPLDRPSRYDRDLPRGGLLNAGPGAAQRAQQVLEELRRRLADPSRPQAEIDYLERLLRRY